MHPRPPPPAHDTGLMMLTVLESEKVWELKQGWEVLGMMMMMVALGLMKKKVLVVPDVMKGMEQVRHPQVFPQSPPTLVVNEDAEGVNDDAQLDDDANDDEEVMTTQRLLQGMTMTRCPGMMWPSLDARARARACGADRSVRAVGALDRADVGAGGPSVGETDTARGVVHGGYTADDEGGGVSEEMGEVQRECDCC